MLLRAFLLAVIAVAALAAADASAQVISTAPDADQSATQPQASSSQPSAESASHVPIWWDVLLIALAGLSVAMILRKGWLRLPERSIRVRLFEPPFAIVLILMFFVMGLLGMRIVAGVGRIPLPPGTLRDSSLLYVGVYSAQAIIAIIYARRAFTVAQPSPDSREGRIASIVISMAALIFIWPVLMVLGNAGGMIMSLLRGEEVSRIAHNTLQLLHDGPTDRWKILMSALVVVGAPILEEVLYRGLIQRTIISTGIRPWPAIIVTSVMFAAMHISAAQPHAVVSLFVLSLAFGWSCERTGRLLAPIAMHMAFNAANLALGLWT